MTGNLKKLKLLCSKIGGVSGCLPAVFIRRTAESDAWTLHRAISLSNNKSTDCKSDPTSNVEMSSSNFPHEDAMQLGHEKSEETYKEWNTYWTTIMNTKAEGGIMNITQGVTMDWNAHRNGTAAGKASGDGRRWIFSMRHGERVDLTYGQWVPHCFDENGTYVRKDLNLPLTLGERAGGKDAYAKDTPLTRLGRMQAHLVGEGLKLAGVTLSHVYSSAALRCVETAHALLEGLNADSNVKIRVEPGLFEYKMWHLNKGIDFMDPIELHKAGLRVDLSYRPYVDLDLTSPETLDEYYKRGETVAHSAVRDTENEGGNVIFVGHAGTLDISTIALKRLASPRKDYPGYQVNSHLLRVPYCALAAMRDKPWQLVSPPCPPSINSSSGRFDWRILKDVI